MKINTLNPYFSIVIPTFNRYEELKRSIGSVIAQSFEDWELIVVDDGSTDQTSTLLADYTSQDKRIKYFQRSKSRVKGASTCRNTGIENAKGDYIAFLDSDDEWKYNKLERDKYRIINKNSSAIYSGIIIDNGETKYKARSRHINSNETYEDLVFGGENFAQTSSMVVKKEILQKVKFDVTLNRPEDMDFFIQVGNQSGWDFYDENLTVLHWEKNVQRMNSSNLDSMRLFYEKHQTHAKSPNNLARFLTWLWVCAARFEPSHKKYFKNELMRIFWKVKLKYKAFILFSQPIFLLWKFFYQK